MNRSTISRREFNAGCAAMGLLLPAMTSVAASGASGHTVQIEGAVVPSVGQGAWHLGQDRHPAAVETDAVRTGVMLGMTLIDTSGNYGDGRSEQFLKQVITDQRAHIYLVSKVEGDRVTGDGIPQSCAASLGRLGTDYLDLYLLHFPVSADLFSGVVAQFEKLRSDGKIRNWGVSNFDVPQMEALLRVPGGKRCATNQVAYSLRNRRIERDVLPWCAQHHMPVMAYSPLGGDNNLVVGARALARIGATHGCPAAAVALAWVIRSGNVIAIPESGTSAHVKENAMALSLALTADDLKVLDEAFPAPTGAS